jgi:hypothetical protein
MRVRSDLRSSIGASIAIVLVIGLAGGLALGAAQAARRTQTAFPRFLVTSNAYDLLVSSEGHGLEGFDQAVAALPQVQEAGLLAGINLFGPIRPGQKQLDFTFSTIGSVDGAVGYTIERPKILAGRMPRPDRADEVFVSPGVGDPYPVTVGERLPMAAITSLPEDPSTQEITDANLTRVTVTVVGIGVTQSRVLSTTALGSQPEMLLTPAFYEKYSGPELVGFDGLVVRVRLGTDRSALSARIDQLANQFGVAPAFVDDADIHAGAVRRAILPQVFALWLFAGLAGAGLILVVGLILARRLFTSSLEYPILQSLGLTRTQLLAGALLLVGTLAVTGAVIAVAVAVLTSSFTPFGVARLAEPDPGLAPNVAMLASGFVLLTVALMAAVAMPAWRAASARGGIAGVAVVTGADRPSSLAERASRGGLPVSAGTGVRMALEPGRGRTAVPVRSGTVGLALAIAFLAASVTFGTNLTRLVDTPRLYGWNWDVMVGSPFGFSAVPVHVLDGVPGIDSYAGGNLGNVTIAGRQVPAVGLDPAPGIAPTFVDGRPPAADDEIALGSKDLARAHASIGDTIEVTIADATTPMHVVGEAVFPVMGLGSFPPTGLGDGALVTATALLPATVGLTPDSPYDLAFVRYSEGADPHAVAAAIEKAAQADPACSPPDSDAPCLVNQPRRPGDISSYASIQATPFALAGLLAVLAFALMTYTLVTSVRRRRRDLAVLKTMGFVRRQVSAAVAWQATTLAAIAGVIGLPLGVIAGRWAWTVFAGPLGVPPAPVFPLIIRGLAFPAGVLAANLVAVVPGRLAARTKPAVVLRSE